MTVGIPLVPRIMKLIRPTWIQVPYGYIERMGVVTGFYPNLRS